MEEHVPFRLRIDADAAAVFAADQPPVPKHRQNPFHRGWTDVKLLGQTGYRGKRLGIDAILNAIGYLFSDGLKVTWHFWGWISEDSTNLANQVMLLL